MKTLARTTPVDFHISPFNKKQKSESSTKLYDYIPTLSTPSRANYFRSSTFYSKIMSYTTDNDELTKPKSVSPDVISISSGSEDNDDLDSILDRLQSLKFDTPDESPEQETDKRKPELYELRKNILNVINEPKIDTDEFDDLFESTKEVIPAVKPLTDKENKLVDSILKRGQVGKVSEFKKVQVSFHDIYKLYPYEWLNDEVINFYMELLSERSIAKQNTTEKSNYPTIHCFTTFFYTTLLDQGYAKVKRWTKRVDIFAKDLVFVPVNQDGNHWILGVFDMRKKIVCIYDSMGRRHASKLQLFLDYLVEEHMDKKKTSLDVSEWKMEITPESVPQQGNMSDCGVFTCTFAERLSRSESFNFSQADINLIRRRIVLNILNKAI